MPYTAIPARPHRLCRACQAGFTLIELLIALSIMATLALLAYPHYEEHMIKARRAEAASALLRAMQQQELYFSRHNSYIAYTGQPPNPDLGLIWFSGDSAGTSTHQIRATACLAHTIEQCVELSATPGGELVGRRFEDSLCGTLKLNSRGEKHANNQTIREAPHACQ
jgi:type IV pilus assembly protein PilE